MNKYIAVSKFQTVKFEAVSMAKAIEWIENHVDSSIEWLVAKIGLAG